MARWKLASGVLVVVVGAAAVGVMVGGANDDEADADASDTPVEQDTAEVTRRDLARSEELDGTIDFGTATSLVLAASGVITDLPNVGEVIRNGDAVLEVDGRPVTAVTGTFPFWRPLNNDMDDGKDVKQLETILDTMGYADEYDVTVDDEFTWNTQQALEAFQEDHGLEDDGELAVGEVVVIPDAVRIDSIGGSLGQPASAAQISVTAPRRTVRADVPVNQAELAAKGTVLEVELPNGDVVDGKVVRVGNTQTDQEGNSTVPVAIDVDGVGGLADGTPVDVRLVVASTEQALAVPVEAILALAEGGYAVEVPAPNASTGPDSAASDEGDEAATRLVPVTIGMFADGWVEISGDIDRGTEVVIP